MSNRYWYVHNYILILKDGKWQDGSDSNIYFHHRHVSYNYWTITASHVKYGTELYRPQNIGQTTIFTYNTVCYSAISYIVSEIGTGVFRQI